jgi:hypothetical protein
MKRTLLFTLTGYLVLFMLFSPPCLTAAPYYEGKVLRMLVGLTPGGGYDRMTRLLAKYINRYIP